MNDDAPDEQAPPNLPQEINYFEEYKVLNITNKPAKIMKAINLLSKAVAYGQIDEDKAKILLATHRDQMRFWENVDSERRLKKLEKKNKKHTVSDNQA